jgi:hypothetical protein
MGNKFVIMKIIHILIVISLSLLFDSCIRTSGFTSGFKSLSEEEKTRIIPLRDEIQDSKNIDSATQRIYSITCNQLRKYIKENNKVLVYDWTPFCRSSSCINPTLIKRFCDENNMKFILIANCYTGVFKFNSNTIQVFSINNEAYRTDVRSRYSRLFYEELTGMKYKSLHSLIYFDNGSFVGSYDNISELHLPST